MEVLWYRKGLIFGLARNGFRFWVNRQQISTRQQEAQSVPINRHLHHMSPKQPIVTDSLPMSLLCQN